MDPTAKTVCVFLDTNVWVKEQLLNSSLGAALLYRLTNSRGKIGLPEVTEKEVRWQISLKGREAVTEIRNNLSIVRSLIGTSDEIQLPAEADFDQAIDSRFAHLSDIIFRLRTTMEQYASALERVIKGTPRKSNTETR